MSKKKIDTRPLYMKEINNFTYYMGYKVTESGLVFNASGRLIKPKFMTKGKRIDYVYLDVTYESKKRRISYHRFIYMAWHKDSDLTGMVVIPLKRRFDYSLKNLACISVERNAERVGETNRAYSKKDIEMIKQAYEEVKNDMTKKDFANKLHISPRTLNAYLKGDNNGV